MFQFFKKIFFIFLLWFLTTVSVVEAAMDGEGSSTVSLNNPLGEGTTEPEVLIGNVINGILGVVGSLALLMFIYGGLVWMTSSGNSEKVQKGKNILIWATLGLVVIFTSYALVNFVLTDVINAPNAGG